MHPKFSESYMQAHFPYLSERNKPHVVAAFLDTEPNKDGHMSIHDIIKKIPEGVLSWEFRAEQILNTNFQQDADNKLLKQYCQPKDELSKQYKEEIDFYNKLIDEFKEILVSKKLSYEEYKVVRAIIDLIEENKKKPYEDNLDYLEKVFSESLTNYKKRPRNKRAGLGDEYLYIAKVPMTTD